MKHIQDYKNFSIEYPLNEDILNENILNDYLLKIEKWWSSFQNKENLYRKINFYLEAGSYTLILAYLYSMVKTMFTHEYNLYIVYYIMSLIFITYKPMMTLRRKLIMNKMKELSLYYDLYPMKMYIYAVIGDKDKINLFLDDMVDKGILDNTHILKTDDITLIDFYGGLKNYQNKEKILREDDPYGEEDWDDEYNSTSEKILDILKRENNINFKIQEKYMIRLRRVIDPVDYHDRNFYKKKMFFKKINK